LNIPWAARSIAPWGAISRLTLPIEIDTLCRSGNRQDCDRAEPMPVTLSVQVEFDQRIRLAPERATRGYTAATQTQTPSLPR
jgi:hypothetical protein